jgi:hypothetical protein
MTHDAGFEAQGGGSSAQHALPDTAAVVSVTSPSRNSQRVATHADRREPCRARPPHQHQHHAAESVHVAALAHTARRRRHQNRGVLTGFVDVDRASLRGGDPPHRWPSRHGASDAEAATAAHSSSVATTPASIRASQQRGPGELIHDRDRRRSLRWRPRSKVQKTRKRQNIAAP